MPIYEFRCAACGRRFEKLCALGENGQNLTCPQCHTAAPKRVMSGFAAAGRRDEAGGGAGSSCAGCSSGNCSSCGH
ncbi:FmdB family zinc ribbon protein [Desulfotomaculum copahuensis]|uniref:FmdB family transcriptional regulator n=1 Tax=Desulfotomaculum copahuensis TaxID=1838280 RepID=A0A1B7LER9_9FIRM|nr:zinc ribbon domain-containing protein [Desulfotomaculum copahuensis]OAT81789.1 FmdB family transcriptional regulator [Desulfotomaculum copahuensis]